MFRKLNRTYSNGYLNYIPKFRENFPELAKIDNEDLCQRFRNIGLDFFEEKQVKVRFLIRLTLPFALLIMLIMLLFSPILYIATGSWKYKSLIIQNWFRELKLI